MTDVELEISRQLMYAMFLFTLYFRGLVTVTEILHKLVQYYTFFSTFSTLNTQPS